MIGHGNLLADPKVAEIKRARRRGRAALRDREGLQFVADVFWFTIEFGVL